MRTPPFAMSLSKGLRAGGFDELSPNGRRRLLLAAGSLTALLSGCGFALRRVPQLGFSRIALVGFAPRSPLAEALKAALSHSVTVVDVPQQAEVVLEALAEGREAVAVASTAAGQVRELQVRARLHYRVSTRGGKPLLGARELVQARDMSYSESAALAKRLELEELHRALEADIVAQVLRSLESVREQP